MRSRFSTFDRVVARVLIWTLTATSVWQIAPPFSLVAVVSAQAPAPKTVTFYGPQRFTRTTGAPNVFTATISVPRSDCTLPRM